jgi:hypothetical protein
MKTIAAISVCIFLSGCLPAPGVFYIGELSDHDQALFREAARIEDVDTVDWPAPGAWVVVYGEPFHKKGFSVPGIMFISEDPRTESGCPRDQFFTVIVRHEIRHTEGEWHSDDPLSVMRDPAPCYPTD